MVLLVNCKLDLVETIAPFISFDFDFSYSLKKKIANLLLTEEKVR